MPHPAGPQSAPLWLRLAPLIFLLLWSGGFATGKAGLAHADPLTLLCLRYALVLALLIPTAAIMRPPMPRCARHWGHLAVTGLLIQASYFGFCYLAMELGVSAGAVALIISLQPVLVAILAPSLVGERIGLLHWAGLVLGLVGAAIVILARGPVDATSAIGLLCAGGALAGMTLGTLYEKRFGTPHHPVTANLVQAGASLAATLPLAVFLEPMRVTLHWELAAALAYLVLANSLVAITLLVAMVRHGTVSSVSSLFFLVPPVAALIAWVILGETMPIMAWPGMALAAVGVALVTRRKRPSG